ncbi:class I SAM-dependent methyltransferase [Endozoicomonas sp. SCSIO W0465]|uniref:class I SAM-dependent methyltransferase n=1 Tax=Endozoicomonas sp. SCSIO W0465 TaxID=2918516 RepID=UPI0020764C59|nr:class I SAM-dependent methyltransferase [Endozoicomonas sp. SCSIO W0465]USE33874.1 class I SAM-dependent methyltransferase [Endozoicomonas sp. SCSIO W0465]
MTSLPLSPQLSNQGQLIVRNQEYFELEHLVVVGLSADELVSHLLSDRVGYITALTRDYSAYRHLKPLQANPGGRLALSFAPILSADFTRPVDGVLLFLQKSKPLMDFWLEMTLSFLPDNAPIWLVGENDEGIKSWKQRLKNSFGYVKSVDNARHCVLLEASEPLKKPESFTLEPWFETFSITAGSANMDITSLPGVFSHGRLDKGTQVLLETLNAVPSGKVLDFGCGAGVISAYINTLPGEHDFTLVDCDALALASSDKTMNATGSESFTVLPSDGLSEVTGPFDLIISNPPFHQGVKTHYEVTEQFLARSCQMLRPGGELRIVANSFLRYPPIIKKAFGHCETLLSRDGFSVYRAFRKRL